MTQGGPNITNWWVGVEPGRAVKLENVGADPPEFGREAFLGADAPAIVRCRVSGDAAGVSADRVEELLAQLEQAAVSLFPRWLPGAARFEGPRGGAVAAVRAVAARTAAASEHYGPYLADLAVRALRSHGDSAIDHRGVAAVAAIKATSSAAPPRQRHPAAIRAAELARIVAAADRRPSAAMIIEAPDELPELAEQALMSAAEWIAYHGAWRIGVITDVRLEPQSTGPGNEGFRRSAVRSAATAGVPIAQPVLGTVVATDPDRTDVSGVLVTEDYAPDSNPADTDSSNPGFQSGPAEGRPRPDSPAELALEAALRTQSWAAERVWNQTYQSGPLEPVYRLDLWWPAERCVVEIDGSEHRSVEHYAADRRRDVELQLSGQSVLRFTNDDVLADVAAVVDRIERFVRSRRP